MNHKLINSLSFSRHVSLFDLLKQSLCIMRLFTTSTSRTMEPYISVKPDYKRLLVDEDLDITIHGLKKQQKVSVYAYLNEENRRYESSGCFVANSDGKVSLKESQSTSGTYKGISSMGLFWSMVPCSGQREGIRLTKNNVHTPLSTKLSVFDGHHNLSKLGTNNQHSPLCDVIVDRWYLDENVKCTEVVDGNIRGKLFTPSGPGPFPSVIDLYGTTGGILEYRASLLASRGIQTLALPYFKYKDLITDMSELQLDYFLDAVEWLSCETGNKRVGVIGLSRGGDLALIIAAYSSKVAAVVNINGCAFNSFTPLKHKGGDIEAVKPDPERIENINGKLAIHKSLNYTEKDITPVWKGNAKVLNIVGQEDVVTPPSSVQMLKSLYPDNKSDCFKIITYPGAGHIIDPPYSIFTGMAYHKIFRDYFLYGGVPDKHAFAQEDMWRKTLDFFHKELS
ncbi:acyl-coenzyme A thioesterase [Mactra antiquata]